MADSAVQIAILISVAIVGPVALWSWRRDHASFVGRLVVAAAVFCLSWAASLGALIRFPGAPVALVFWLPSATLSIAAIFMLAKAGNRPAWRPGLPLLAVVGTEAVATSALSATNSHHHIVAKEMTTEVATYGWGFGVHVALDFALLVGVLLEMSRRLHDPARWMRWFAVLIVALVVAAASVQVLQLRISVLLASLAVGGFALAVNLGRLGHREPELDHATERTDTLTGTLSRRAMEALLTRAARKASGSDYVVVVDVDRFKAVNDRYGHVAGDRVLVEVAHRLTSSATDLHLGRFGGDEFVGLLPDIDALRAAEVTEQLTDAVSATPVTVRDGEEVSVSVSVGVALCRGDDWRTWIEEADLAMYRAKRGRAREGL
ncbi:MAG: diguanylate cyclase [Nocardioides sp.]|uniref:GGDEF domain-containing protein n=1 Tax=Nocardioides sp. TaxID=35761 RepID=UPI0039E412ED